MWVISISDSLGKLVCCLGVRMAFGRSSDIFKSNHLKMHVFQCFTCLERSEHFTYPGIETKILLPLFSISFWATFVLAL